MLTSPCSRSVVWRVLRSSEGEEQRGLPHSKAMCWCRREPIRERLRPCTDALRLHSLEERCALPTIRRMRAGCACTFTPPINSKLIIGHFRNDLASDKCPALLGRQQRVLAFARGKAGWMPNSPSRRQPSNAHRTRLRSYFLLQITLCGTILKSIITQISSSHPGGRR